MSESEMPGEKELDQSILQETGKKGQKPLFQKRVVKNCPGAYHPHAPIDDPRGALVPRRL